MTTLPEPIERTFVWQRRTVAGLFATPIRITWSPAVLSANMWHWVPASITVDGGGGPLTVHAMKNAPWQYAITKTDPNVNGSLPVPDLDAVDGPVMLETLERHLGPRAYNALRRTGITKAETVAHMTDAQLAKVEGLGEKTISHIRHVFDKYGLNEIVRGGGG